MVKFPLLVSTCTLNVSGACSAAAIEFAGELQAAKISTDIKANGRNDMKYSCFFILVFPTVQQLKAAAI